MPGFSNIGIIQNLYNSSFTRKKMLNSSLKLEKKKNPGQVHWLTPVILDTWEAKI
jgi:hypothetical protein